MAREIKKKAGYTHITQRIPKLNEIFGIRDKPADAC